MIFSGVREMEVGDESRVIVTVGKWETVIHFKKVAKKMEEAGVVQM